MWEHICKYVYRIVRTTWALIHDQHRKMKKTYIEEHWRERKNKNEWQKKIFQHSSSFVFMSLVRLKSHNDKLSVAKLCLLLCFFFLYVCVCTLLYSDICLAVVLLVYVCVLFSFTLSQCKATLLHLKWKNNWN